MCHLFLATALSASERVFFRQLRVVAWEAVRHPYSQSRSSKLLILPTGTCMSIRPIYRPNRRQTLFFTIAYQKSRRREMLCADPLLFQRELNNTVFPTSRPSLARTLPLSFTNLISPPIKQRDTPQLHSCSPNLLKSLGIWTLYINPGLNTQTAEMVKYIYQLDTLRDS